RIRWAAKTSAYNNWFGKLTGLIVLTMNAIIIMGLTLSIVSVLPFKILFYIAFIKFNIDFFLIYKSATFFKQNNILKSYIFGFLFYPFFSVYVACISTFSGYKWKGRNFKK
ncbi:MAG: glycosyltransferase, partial [Algibacter sp.]